MDSAEMDTLDVVERLPRSTKARAGSSRL